MKNYLSVFIFGAFGGILRILIPNISINNASLKLFMINALGSFLLGVLTYTLSENKLLSESIKIGLRTGLFGGFTSFSSFIVLLSNTNQAVANLSYTLLILLFAFTGQLLGQLFINYKIKN